MTAAFVLGINMFVGAIFAVAFGVVAATNPTARGARWLAAGYAMGVIDAMLEFGLRWQGDPLAFTVAIFLAFLAAITFCLIGVARHYRTDPPWVPIGLIWVASLVAVPLLFSLPYPSAGRAFFYQLPYAVMQALVGWAVYSSGRRQPLDLLLIALSSIVAAVYLLKPAIVWFVGSAASPEGYMASLYAAISQSIGSITLIALALVMLLVMMRDATMEMVARSETDPLSGALNRRGFDEHGERMIGRAHRKGDSLTLVTADIDHFKAVNDRFGHAAGDEVIAHFATLLRNAANDEALVARLGGEEFAVLLKGADLAEGRRYAEEVREAISHEPLPAAPDCLVTSSFGVAQLGPGDGLFDLTRQSDAALYRAKGEGRDRVNVALRELPSALSVSISEPKTNRAPALMGEAVVDRGAAPTGCLGG